MDSERYQIHILNLEFCLSFVRSSLKLRDYFYVLITLNMHSPLNISSNFFVYLLNIYNQ